MHIVNYYFTTEILHALLTPVFPRCSLRCCFSVSSALGLQAEIATTGMFSKLKEFALCGTLHPAVASLQGQTHFSGNL